MKYNQILKSLVFGIFLVFLFTNTNSQNITPDTISVSSEKIEQTTNVNSDEVDRLKSEKNALLVTIREKDTTIRYIALALTVITILLLIFFFAFLSVKRKKRIELAELNGKILKLKS